MSARPPFLEILRESHWPWLLDFSRFFFDCYTISMSIETSTNGVDLQEHTDAEAVLRHAFDGQALDPDIARRVHDRAARITEEIRRKYGVIDDGTFHDLLYDEEP
ncbi:MAG TPA: hypothetical protein VFW75_15570 [Acetobacteraceae bacterium]|nr:hypothetical protein [Acetobacteraceae bacterium]